MSKRLFFATLPVLMFASSAMADDSMLSMIANLDGAKDSAALVADEDKLGQADVDALLGDDQQDSEEAVAACFRRYGGHSHGSYGHRSYGYSSYSYCQPYHYSYHNYCAPTYSYCAPVTYSYVTPVTYSCYSPCYTSYWGCW